jgi:hypothetical protein
MGSNDIWRWYRTRTVHFYLEFLDGGFVRFSSCPGRCTRKVERNVATSTAIRKAKPIVQLDALCQLLPPSRFDDLLQTMDLNEMEENANSHSFEETLMIVDIQNGGVDVGGSNCAELQGSPLRYNSLRLSCIPQLCNLVLQFWYASLRPPCMVCLHVLRSSLRPKHRYASH